MSAAELPPPRHWWLVCAANWLHQHGFGGRFYPIYEVAYEIGWFGSMRAARRWHGDLT